MIRALFSSLHLVGLLLLTPPSLALAEVQIERIFLPHGASPSSFAIALPGGANFCFDPVRGAVSYVWSGDFLDPSPARPGVGKFIHPARLLGPIVHQEAGAAPLRRGDPTRTPEVEFTGYSLHATHVEFRYRVDGLPVREEIRVRGESLVRRLHVGGATDARWWYVVEGRPPAELRADAAGFLELTVPLRASTP